jgi:hypothetical protein
MLQNSLDTTNTHHLPFPSHERHAQKLTLSAIVSATLLFDHKVRTCNLFLLLNKSTRKGNSSDSSNLESIDRLSPPTRLTSDNGTLAPRRPSLSCVRVGEQQLWGEIGKRPEERSGWCRPPARGQCCTSRWGFDDRVCATVHP